jgi:acyl carrier protein
MGTKEEVVPLICEVFDVKEDEVNMDVSLYDSLGVDSTEMVELRVAINKKLGVNLAQGEISNRHTPNQIIEIVEKKKSS